MGIFAMGVRDSEPAGMTPTEPTQGHQQEHTDQEHLGAFGKGGGKDTSHVIALRLTVPTARLPALMRVTVATAKATGSKNAPPPTQS